MKKPKFVPTPDLLETRIALSGGPRFTQSGAAILTSHALGQSYAQVEKAFVKFAQHGQNYQMLENNLAKAVNNIPWNRRDGLLATVESEAQAVRTDIQTALPRPIATEMQNTLAEVKDFVLTEVAEGQIVVRESHGLENGIARFRHRRWICLLRCRVDFLDVGRPTSTGLDVEQVERS